MQINGETNSQDIISDIDFWAGTNSSNYETNDKFRSVNEWYRTVNSWIWQSAGDWEFDDSKYTTLPEATTDLVDGQADYSLPSTAQKLRRVEILDSSGDWQIVHPYDESQIQDEGLSEAETEEALPQYYRTEGRSLIFQYPIDGSKVTTTNGLKIYVSRYIDEFAVTDTTDTPGFNEDYHRILSMGAALDYCLAKGKDEQVTRLNALIQSKKKDLQEFYGSRHRNFKNSLGVVDEPTI